MYIVSVTLFVKPECVEQFKAATLDNARNTRREPGNVRFDVLQAADNPNQFQLYEAYHGPEGFAAHQTTTHYARWRDSVGEWLSQPRTAVKSNSLFFGDE